MLELRRLALVLLLIGLAAPAVGWSGTVTFEGLADLTPVTNQFPGIVFSNATILTAGASLPGDFPPHSGSNVVFDDGGPIFVDFSSPITSAGAFFTYGVPITVFALDAANNVLASAASSSTANFVGAGTGVPPNEFISVALGAGYSRLAIRGSNTGASFVMDDLTTTSTVPEPSTFLVLFALGGLAVGVRRRAR